MYGWFREKKRPLRSSAVEEYERCVLCGRRTEVPVTRPVEQRESFVSGCGQLCPACREWLRREQQRMERTGRI